jgi:hypothetical protein
MSKLALITGASSGIGEVFARKLAVRGYDLILVARREDRLRTLATSLSTNAEIVTADLSTEEGIAAVERAIHSHPALDLLVNNAGFGTRGRFWETDLAGQVHMHEVHVMATMRLTRAALAGMVPRGRGGVISVSSVAAWAQSEGGVSYCATKAWINSFTESLDLELRGINSPVKVQALCPGFTVTEFHDALGGADFRRKVGNWLWMTAGDVVQASLDGFDRGDLIVVPGWKYKLAVFLLKHVPYEIKRRVARPGGKRV